MLCWRRRCLRTVAVLLLVLFLTGFFFTSLSQWCKNEEISPALWQPVEKEMTIVTMFIDLGVFKKGDQPLSYHSPYKYRRWMRTFGKIANHVVAFIEKDEDVEYFREIRSCLPPRLTKVIKVNREELPSFKHLSRIAEIYADPSYPKHYPNTVSAEYTCAMHAKYDALEKASTDDTFKNPYIAWVDVGLFRNLDGTKYRPFKLIPPQTFDKTAVGFSYVWPQRSESSVHTIMRQNLVWLAGGLVLAKREVMLKFTQDYQAAVEELLHRGLSNTDQEVIASMYSPEMLKEDYIKVQTFRCDQGQMGLFGPDARYLCLGYLCRHEWQKREMGGSR
ncbi:uncharacterized protein LOC101857544 isoform X2 [Aplysia californica]|uniref:Uncharacterized protein LOC101857544 isoform X2 n=1 Tax=Aplysia californica TaxID=6500 RepID=A0ABM1W587_APLCA|nr:uncharacterized protein LOC101857544 isoform X2 [Aplysia californica]